MGRIFSFLIFISALGGQNYSANVYGFPVAKAKYNLKADSVKLKYETVGIIDMIWPAVNTYTTHFDSVHFGLKSFKKKIKQEDFKQRVFIELKNGILKFKDETRNFPDSTQTLFTSFVRLIRQPYKILDTKWFEMEHEGRPMRGRFLWAGTETIKVGNTNILCDYFRMDMEYINDSAGFLQKTDRLMHYAPNPDAVRQIWVERNGNRRIIRVKITAYGFPYEIIIADK
ncbi:MAG: DUF3108 domain-containing protein [Candidatus Marinimicrobia bacterium]|nr:DUF3108 domain-containing protein [Candidatus Neomarinimicrobiota bacterium]